LEAVGGVGKQVERERVEAEVKQVGPHRRSVAGCEPERGCVIVKHPFEIGHSSRTFSTTAKPNPPHTTIFSWLTCLNVF